MSLSSALERWDKKRIETFSRSSVYVARQINDWAKGKKKVAVIGLDKAGRLAVFSINEALSRMGRKPNKTPLYSLLRQYVLRRGLQPFLEFLVLLYRPVPLLRVTIDFVKQVLRYLESVWVHYVEMHLRLILVKKNGSSTHSLSVPCVEALPKFLKVYLMTL